MIIDVQEALSVDVVDELERLHGPDAKVDYKTICDMMEEFSQFSEEKDAEGPTLERIYIKKDSTWLPVSGKSVKAGNIRFNLGKLFESAVSGAGAYFTTVANPIFGVLVAIVALRSLMQAATVELSEKDALLLWATWMCEQRGENSNAQSVREVFIEECTRYGKQITMSIEEIMAGLSRLERIYAVRCQDEEWEVIETVVVDT